VLPFEVISILLLAALVGAVTLARGRVARRNSGPAPSPTPTPSPKPETRSPKPEVLP